MIIGIIIAVAAVAVLWLLMIMPRMKHPSVIYSLCANKFAHRGLYDNDSIPENSMAAFRKAIECGYAFEFDVHLTKDDDVVVFHDYSLDRICGDSRKIEDTDFADLKDMKLLGTDQGIPSFEEVLAEADGRVPLLIEIKATFQNYSRLCERTSEILKSYNGEYCIESFDPRVIYWFRKNRPDCVRGQLSGYINKHGDYHDDNGKKLNPAGDFFLRNLLVNFIGKPDFIAYRESDRKNISLRLCKKLFKPPVFYWTLDTDSYDDLEENDTIIFERR